MAKRKKNRGGIVYSTDTSFSAYEAEVNEEAQTLPAQQQDLRLHLDRLKGNKVATRIAGFVGAEEDLKDLGKALKNQCGVGGSAKDGMVLLQGDVRDKVEKYLNQLGYKHKRSGG